MKKLIGIGLIIGLVYWYYNQPTEANKLIDEISKIGNKAKSAIKNAVSQNQEEQGDQKTDQDSNQVDKSGKVKTNDKKSPSRKGKRVTKKIKSIKFKMNLIKTQLSKKKIVSKFFPNKSRLKTEPDKDYYVSNILRAVSSKNFDSRLGEKVEEKHGYTFYKVPSINDDQVMVGEKTSLPMVLNLKNHSFGVVTGKFIINLKRNEKINPILKKYKLSLDYKSEGVVYYYTSTKASPNNYGQIYKDLKNDDRIKYVEMEIIDSSDLPQ